MGEEARKVQNRTSHRTEQGKEREGEREAGPKGIANKHSNGIHSHNKEKSKSTVGNSKKKKATSLNKDNCRPKKSLSFLHFFVICM